MQKPAKYLVVIESGGPVVARLFDDGRNLLAEFDASSEEVALMTRGLSSSRSAGSAPWDKALAGHNLEERRTADVYALDA